MGAQIGAGFLLAKDVVPPPPPDPLCSTQTFGRCTVTKCIGYTPGAPPPGPPSPVDAGTLLIASMMGGGGSAAMVSLSPNSVGYYETLNLTQPVWSDADRGVEVKVPGGPQVPAFDVSLSGPEHVVLSWNLSADGVTVDRTVPLTFTYPPLSDPDQHVTVGFSNAMAPPSFPLVFATCDFDAPGESLPIDALALIPAGGFTLGASTTKTTTVSDPSGWSLMVTLVRYPQTPAGGDLIVAGLQFPPM
jgi:hypothetical protein